MKNADLPPALLHLTARPKAQTKQSSFINPRSISNAITNQRAQNEEKKMLEFKKYNSIETSNDQLTLSAPHMEHGESHKKVTMFASANTPPLGDGL